ncbi:MAG: hypothetical protein L6Q97_22230, partial [Thermoanaerobaculia bacterium]|nr:hypothetical protein [Thermoanaerobaculia bacterium]
MPSITLNGSLLTLQNDFAALQIDLGTAKTTSLKVLAGSQELVDPDNLETFVKYWEYPPAEDPTGQAVQCSPNSLQYCESEGILKAYFKANNAVIFSIRCRAEANHFFFELQQIDGPEAEIAKIGAAWFAGLALTGQHYGDLIGAVGNDGFVTALMPLNMFTKTYSGQWSTRKPIYGIGAQCYRLRAEGWDEFRLEGAQTALLTCPEAGCLEHLESIVDQYGLPKPQHNGVWHKKHPDIRRSYLFVDITGENYAQIIQWAKKGKFGHIMPYVSIWSNSIGSYHYDDNPNFPTPNTLPEVVNKIHQHGLKFGLHHLSFMLDKSDPVLADDGLLQIAWKSSLPLKQSISPDETDIYIDPAASPGLLEDFRNYFYIDGEKIIRIEKEIILCNALTEGPAGPLLTVIQRGYHGTTAAAHGAGIAIYRPCIEFGSYLADVHSSLPDVISERLKTICQTLGVDFLFLDGADVTDRQFPTLINSTAQWYAAPLTVEKLTQALDGKLLLQNSAGVAYLWYRTTRGNSGDYVTIGVEPHLDYDRIGIRWDRRHSASCMPMELGWFGFFAKLDCYRQGIAENNKTGGEIYNKSYAATTLDEVEYLLNRSLGFDLPFGLETHFDELEANALTQKVFKLIGKYEHLRLNSPNIPPDLRKNLQRPNEEFIDQYQLLKEQYRMGGCPPFFYRFYRQAYFEKVLHDGESWDFVNPFHEQPLQVKITALPGVASAENVKNIELLDRSALNLYENMNNNSIVEFPKGNKIVSAAYDNTTGQITADYKVPEPEQLSEFAWCSLGHDLNEVNLMCHKVIFVDLQGDGKGAVLNIQLTDDSGNHRVYQVVLEDGVSCRRQFVFHQPTTTGFYRYPPCFGGMLNFKYFDFSKVRKLSLYVQHIREGAGNEVNITLHAIKALKQDRNTTVQNPELTLNQKVLQFPFELHPVIISIDNDNSVHDPRKDREPWEYAELSGFFRRKYDGNHQPL